MTLDIAVIPGDGIGPEVCAEALKVLEALAPLAGVPLRVRHYPLGANHWLKTGETLNDSTLQALRAHQAILLGAVGVHPQDERVPSGLIERELLLTLRFRLDHGLNLRPAKLYPGVSSPLADPGNIDLVVYREGTEGAYCGVGGVVRAGTDQEIAHEVCVNTAPAVQRVVRAAFERARRRPRQRVTYVHKHNVLVHAGHLWRRIVEHTHEDYPQVKVDYLHVDAAAMLLATEPARFDVVVTDNLFGDILTDLAAAVTGGIGLAASANINLEGTAPSMFEPVHGSAPDLAGTGGADPTAAILSAQLLLEHLGYAELAQRLEGAVTSDLARRRGLGPRSTSEIGDAIVTALSGGS